MSDRSFWRVVGWVSVAILTLAIGGFVAYV